MLVSDLLLLARLEGTNADNLSQAVPVHGMLKRMRENALAISADKGHSIELDVPEEARLIANPAELESAFGNLITNAVKYTPAGGSVTVRIQNNRGKTTFSIENDSKPLSAEALAKVWDTFYRVDESRSGGGTGLGLAIAKNIVELHGGKCSVRNTKTGVEFQFTI